MSNGQLSLIGTIGTPLEAGLSLNELGMAHAIRKGAAGKPAVKVFDIISGTGKRNSRFWI